MEYLIYLIIIILIYSILALSLNLLIGYTGLLSVMHAAFFGLGAYANAILTVKYGLPFFAAMAACLSVALIISLIVGIILGRFKDDYYALATLGFNAIIYFLILNWQNVTGGPLGISGVKKPILTERLSPDLTLFTVVLISAVSVYLVSAFLARSSFGSVLKAIREDEEIAKLVGYKTELYKLAVFVASAIMAGLAGFLFASQISFISPASFTLSESIFILSVVILGGLSNLKGSILGAVFLVILPEALSFIGLSQELAAQVQQALYGLILIFLMLYRPQGLFGEYKL